MPESPSPSFFPSAAVVARMRTSVRYLDVWNGAILFSHTLVAENYDLVAGLAINASIALPHSLLN